MISYSILSTCMLTRRTEASELEHLIREELYVGIGMLQNRCRIVSNDFLALNRACCLPSDFVMKIASNMRRALH